MKLAVKLGIWKRCVIVLECWHCPAKRLRCCWQSLVMHAWGATKLQARAEHWSSAGCADSPGIMLGVAVTPNTCGV